MTDKTGKVLRIVCIAAIVLLLWQNFGLNRKLEQMNSQLNALHSQVDIGLNSVEYTLSNMFDERLAQMKKEANPSYDETATVVSFVPGGMVEAELRFGLKAYRKGAEVQVAAHNGSGSLYSAVAEDLGSGRYKARVSVPVKGEYSFSYALEDEASGSSGQLVDWFSAEQNLLERLKCDIGSSSYSHDDVVVTSPRVHLVNVYNGNNMLKFKRVRLTATRGDTMSFDEDLTQYIIDEANAQVLTQSRETNERGGTATYSDSGRTYGYTPLSFGSAYASSSATYYAYDYDYSAAEEKSQLPAFTVETDYGSI